MSIQGEALPNPNVPCSYPAIVGVRVPLTPTYTAYLPAG